MRCPLPGTPATARATGDDALLHRSLPSLAPVRNEPGRHAVARDLTVETPAVRERIGTEAAVADTRLKLARVLQRLGEHQQSFDLGAGPLAVARRFGDLPVVGRTIDRMGTARMSQGRAAEAGECREKAVRAFTGIGSVEDETVRRRLAEHFSGPFSARPVPGRRLPGARPPTARCPAAARPVPGR
ncbi:hypothetical protein [Kitasatospora sp. NPDC088783]|uniref:hypothetical protein n=1 Tax=Kitasatospora sp. NPDC088783 TaxID=3364077 RepID=UPI003807DA77